MKNASRNMAFGGMMAAVAVSIMCLGGLIPVATYVCPMLSMMILTLVLRMSNQRVAWAWYGAVAVLGLLIAPDKEAAAVFLALGYYPILKPWMDQRKFRWLWKGLYFNAVILSLYSVLLHLIGMEQLVEEFSQFGTAMVAVMVLMGNATFFLLDRILGMNWQRKMRGGV